MKRVDQLVDSVDSNLSSLLSPDHDGSQGGGNKSMDGLKIQDVPLQVFHVHFSTRTHGSSSAEPIGGHAASPEAFHCCFIFCWQVRWIHLDQLCFLSCGGVFVKSILLLFSQIPRDLVLSSWDETRNCVFRPKQEIS